MSGTAAALRLIEHGQALLPTQLVDLQPTPSGTWTSTGLEVVLSAAGTYQLDATVRAAMTGTSPVNTFIWARLFDVDAGAVVPDSEVFVLQLNPSVTSGTITDGKNQTASIQVEYTVPGPRRVRLEAARTNNVGASSKAEIWSNSGGRTLLRYLRIA
ncbi:hypothetical protein H114_32784 [Streptomyces gancidicus BKS 13-15]|uniref:Uncharacterized protein n=1 Tax=Streptomyces gancidicus BKS 13-15 TaxID=1284664 RepID=M3C8L8_STREZ|nr:hypothetical protein [Streptomyces gancidicus]EMF20418.1 hypothetical protein H114_32784 [Streptomyces gancidicus BKS 13-15]